MTVCGVCTHKLDVTLASFTRADGAPPLTATKLVRIILSLKLLHTLNSPVELKGEPSGEPRHSALCSNREGGSEEPALVMESRLISFQHEITRYNGVFNVEFPLLWAPE